MREKEDDDEENQNIDFYYTIRDKFKNPNLEILQGQSPNKEIQKSFYERKEKRIKKYSKLIRTFTKDISIHKQKLNTIYYKNKFFLLHNILHMSKSSKIETKNNIIESLLNSRESIRDRFVGLSLKYDYEKIVGFGIIKDFNNNNFVLQSSIDKFDNIFLSDIKLSLGKDIA
jgi:hypothetical protein